ncbi:hypothetical protein [Lysinibacillus sp. NPDC086135]|uniref:hypothetical protein n=1 Tax=Lysinibacillus sp. NPDC086135 TaxID=3364130 RepID=UPI00380767D9
MSNQKNYVKMNLEFLAEGISPTELMVYFNDFLKEKTQLVSQSGRTADIEIVWSNITSIVQFDEEENEREFLDAKGNLQLTDAELQMGDQ